MIKKLMTVRNMNIDIARGYPLWKTYLLRYIPTVLRFDKPGTFKQKLAATLIQWANKLDFKYNLVLEDLCIIGSDGKDIIVLNGGNAKITGCSLIRTRDGKVPRDIRRKIEEHFARVKARKEGTDNE